MLYHISDKKGIKIFLPRTITYNSHIPPSVWAIDENHCVNYYFPRDFPRIIYSRSHNISPEDAGKFFKGTDSDRIITIEKSRKEQLVNSVIYKYTFPEDGFELYDKIAGYYISYNEVIPIKEEPLTDLINKIKETGAELRFIENLKPLREAILNSTIDNFSMIKLS
jgi:hypothetical protein